MLRKLLTTTALICLAGGSALAADLPSEKGPPVYAPPPPPAFSWSGVYLGGQVGYGWGTTNTSDALGSYPSANQDGVIGGVHIGYNYQVSQFVFGLEGDVNGSSESDGVGIGAGAGYNIRENIDASIRGRVGYAFDRVLIYATGGAAYGSFHSSFYAPGFAGDSYNNDRIGWTVGGGLEYAIDNNWSVRAEYRYTDYGTLTSSAVPEDFGLDIHQHIRDNRVQVGFSYKFDLFQPPAPIVSKY